MSQTIGRALDEFEAALFVGRDKELDAFTAWLCAAEGPPVLNVVGRGGMGKSTLLSAFRRAARDMGREVVSVDADGIDATPQGFMSALVGEGDPIEFCNANRCLVLIDAFAKVPWLTRFLQDELLPPLSREVKVVISGRIPLGWPRWNALIETMTLGALPTKDAREYLRRRGIDQPQVAEQILSSTGGLPIALALAADVVVKVGAHDLGAVNEWRLVLRSLVEQLMNDVADPGLAQLLEACAIVRHFDEPTLNVMTDMDDVSSAFARLCGLSVVRAGEHGLMLHDDVRKVLVEDLRWRNPERHGELRERALAYLRGRMARASVAERHWLWAERMFLWEDAFMHSVLFGPSGSSEMTVTLGGPADADDALALERRWHDEILPDSSPVEWSDDYPQEAVLAWLGRAMRMRGARLALARDVQGRITGYSLVLPLFQESLRLFRAEETLSALLRAKWSEEELARAPLDPGDSDLYVIVRTCVGERDAEAANGALFRDLLGLLAQEGVYVVYAAFPENRALYEMLGFVPVRTAEVYHWIANYPFQAYVLDLKRIGFEAWIEAIMAGRTPSRRPSADELESEFAELLPRWGEDKAVEASMLGQIVGDADGVRGMIRAAIEGLRSDEDLTLPLRAVELAYLERAASHERLAERLAVSRSTFYRLLRRGVRAVAEAVGRPA